MTCQHSPRKEGEGLHATPRISAGSSAKPWARRCASSLFRGRGGSGSGRPSRDPALCTLWADAPRTAGMSAENVRRTGDTPAGFALIDRVGGGDERRAPHRSVRPRALTAMVDPHAVAHSDLVDIPAKTRRENLSGPSAAAATIGRLRGAREVQLDGVQRARRPTGLSQLVLVRPTAILFLLGSPGAALSSRSCGEASWERTARERRPRRTCWGWPRRSSARLGR